MKYLARWRQFRIWQVQWNQEFLWWSWIHLQFAGAFEIGAFLVLLEMVALLEDVFLTCWFLNFEAKKFFFFIFCLTKNGARWRFRTFENDNIYLLLKYFVVHLKVISALLRHHTIELCWALVYWWKWVSKLIWSLKYCLCLSGTKDSIFE